MYHFIRQILREAWLFCLRLVTKKTIYDLHIVKIRQGEIKGMKMILNLSPTNGWIDSEYLKGYKQEEAQISIVKKLISKNQRIWDIGIYRGFYTLLFAELVGKKGIIIGIDIDNRNCEVVRQLLYINKIPNVTIYNYGLFNKNTTQSYISSNSSNSRLLNTLKGDYTQNTILLKNEKINQAKFTTFNSLVDKIGTADVIKVDIDGAELYALDAAEKIFLNPDVIMLIESHNHETNKKITEFFNSNNCSVYSINEKRFFNNSEMYCGTSIGCKNRLKLQNLLD